MNTPPVASSSARPPRAARAYILGAFLCATVLASGCGACDPLSDTTRLRVKVLAGIFEMDQFAVSILSDGERIVDPQLVPDDPRSLSSEGETVTLVLEDEHAGKNLRVRVDAYFNGDLVASGAVEPVRATAGELVDVQVPMGMPAVVGDGIIARGLEDCDDGNTDNDDGCSDIGTFEAGWLCNAAEPTVCTNNCGDGLVVGPEACDDGNATNQDGCSACALEPGFTCQGEPSVCEAGCGNGVISGGEACDDGNLDADDGCTANCAVEDGYTCVGAPSTCVRCGNGVREENEACDDGNDIPGDGCGAACRIEPGFTCEGDAPTVCVTDCGDGVRTAAEDCDDNNLAPGDGCDASCHVEAGFECSEDAGGTSLCGPDCGDGQIVVGIEACDDGNTDEGDGCSPSCAVEFGWSCPGGVCQAVCGDGVKVGNEACDDGNPFSGDGCSATCESEAAELCGNGVLDGNETCDYGPAGGDEAACTQCRVTSGFVCAGEPSTCSFCGDAILQPNETCDYAVSGFDGFCDPESCELEAGVSCIVENPESVVCQPSCGDGFVDPDFGEQCDDSNVQSDDGCSQNCLVEPGYGCPPQGGECSTVCGDGIITQGEECDSAGGPGCDPQNCTVEPGFVCTDEPSDCVADTCGNGALGGGEECDDGNNNDGDGCGADCLVDPDYACPVPGQPCIGLCGDGQLTAQETCDDGNAEPDDGCSAYCIVEPGFSCDGALPSACQANCADGLIRGAEACDDANLISNDGCTATCVVEDGWNCFGEPSECAADCGNGVTDGAEGCDDGNANPGDGCSALCEVEAGYVCVGTPSLCSLCGDSILAPSEGCDDGNLNDGDGCSANCDVESGYTCDDGSPTLCTRCGDGVRTDEEACDDGDTDGGDGCDANCTVEPGWLCAELNGPESASSCAQCGDGNINNDLEFCDDFNTTDGDGCESDCRVTPGYNCEGEPSECTPAENNCPNGVLDVGEDCDDGNTDPADGCAGCQVTEGWVCPVVGARCVTCGDGHIDDANNEDCDDGNKSGGDGCSSLCQVEEAYTCIGGDVGPSLCGRCGDSRKQVFLDEECDDGNDTNEDACLNACRLNRCGDGFVKPVATANGPREECDDGNDDSTDACLSCQWARCGDNNVFVDFEQCDKGNQNGDRNAVDDPNTCKTTCSPPVCGDEIVQQGELCDPLIGTASFSSGCNADCEISIGFQCRGEPSVCVVPDALPFGDNRYVSGGNCEGEPASFLDGVWVNTCLNDILSGGSGGIAEDGLLYLPQGDYHGLVVAPTSVRIVGERAPVSGRPLSFIIADASIGLILGDENVGKQSFLVQNVAITGVQEDLNWTPSDEAPDPPLTAGILVAGDHNVRVMRSEVTGNDGVGIIATGEGSIQIESSYISENRQGGLYIAQSPDAATEHRVANTVIVENGNVDESYRGAFGGVIIPSQTQFAFNTVAANLAVAALSVDGEAAPDPISSGVTCYDPLDPGGATLTGLIVWDNIGAAEQIGGNCGTLRYSAVDTNVAVGSLNTTLDPMVDPSNAYRLLPGSVCVDFVTGAAPPNPRDFQLHRRPHPSTGIPDCGADEAPLYDLSGGVVPMPPDGM